MPSAVTNDSNARAILTVNATGTTNGVNWSASVADNNASVGGFGDSGFWSITVGGVVVATASGTYDFGSGVYSSPYFPRSEGSFLSLAPGSYTASGTFRGNIGSTTVGTATVAPFSFTVTSPPPVFTDSTINSIAIRNVAYSDSISATNSPTYSISSSSLPTGLSLNSSTGAITGTATITFQSRSPVFRASNTGGFVDSPARSIVVNPPAPVFSDATIISEASVGSSYSDQVVASDVVSYSVFSGALPDGISLDTSTGVIFGSPTTSASFTFVIRATNVTGFADTPTLTITTISPVRVWDGDEFISGQVSVWNGNEFLTGVVKIWNGTTFVSAQ